MDPINDGELLRRFAEHGDDTAFAEVVKRHVDLVYSVGKRLAAGDSHLAEDVSQQVFTAMAQQARSLAAHPTLVGWLHATTRNIVYKAIRKENRRRAREQELFTMQNVSTQPEISWEKLQPVLDEAVSRLGGPERDAILLRFFEGKSHREVGDRVGLSEDSARKRVDRALEKLRTYFSRSGITVSAGLLGEAISANSVQAAPAGFAEGLAGSVLAQATAAPVTYFVFLKSILFMTTTTKIILGATAILAAAASFYYFTLPAQSVSYLPNMEASGNGATLATVPQVAAHKQGAAAVASTSNSASQPATAAQAGQQAAGSVAAGPADAQALTKEATTMLSSMKLAFVEVAVQLKNSDDLSGVEDKINALEAQLTALQVKAAGTPIVQQLTPAVNALKAVQVPLQRGDVAAVRAVLQKLSAGGPPVPAK